jgi:hypothetical protein
VLIIFDRIFKQGTQLLEGLNTNALAQDTERFQWFIGTHSAFHAIMYVLSELRDPTFMSIIETSTREEAIQAVRAARLARSTIVSGPWVVIKRMIESAEQDYEREKEVADAASEVTSLPTFHTASNHAFQTGIASVHHSLAETMPVDLCAIPNLDNMELSGILGTKWVSMEY